MRVITGKARGAKLNTLEGLGTRPTTEKVKEAVFSSLFDRVQCNRVLDLFAGSGQMGIEALSRGAKQATFVEQDKHAVAIIKQNLIHTKLDGFATVQMSDAFSFIKLCRVQYDLVFLDPPYNQGLAVSALEALDKADCVSTDGMIVCESDLPDEIPEKVGAFVLQKQAKYGRVVISYFSKEDVR